MAKEYIIGQEYLDSHNQKKTAYFKDAEAVSTTEVQELTDGQKHTARNNIGASSLTDLQIIMSQLVDLRTKDNFITKNLGYKGTVMAHGEAQALQPVTSGDASIAWVVFTYGDENSQSTAMIHQKHGETTTVQTMFFGNRVANRTITFTDSTRTSIESTTAWGTVTSLLGVQATQNNIVLRLMNSHLDGSQGLYMLTLPALTSTASGVITPSQFASLVNGGDYDSNSKTIRLKHGNTVLASIDATAFIKDGMVSNVGIRNGQLVILFNTDAGKEDIRIPLTEIFNPDNYYTKTEINNLIEDSNKVYVDDTVAIHHLPEGEIVEDEVKEALKAFRANAAGGKSLVVFERYSDTGIVATVQSWGSSFEMWFFYNGKFCRVTADPSDELWEAHWVNLENAVQPDDEDYIELQEKVADLDETAVRTGSYDGTVAVGLADNLRGDSIVDAEFYKRKTGGTQSVGSGIAAIKEVRGKSIVWNQILQNGNFIDATGWSFANTIVPTFLEGGGVKCTINLQGEYNRIRRSLNTTIPNGHKVLLRILHKTPSEVYVYLIGHPSYATYNDIQGQGNTEYKVAAFLQTLTGDFSEVEIRINTKNTPSIPVDVYLSKFQIFDLTLMFGAGNEPATVEEFEKMFPLDYYDYNAGEVIPFAGQNLVTTGFNQWDEQWINGYYEFGTGRFIYTTSSYCTKNPIKVIGGQQYNINLTNDIGVCYYDSNMNHIISGWYAGIKIAPDNACYMHVNLGTNAPENICINISDPDRNGTYEPYEKHTLPLDPSQWRDKQGNLVFPYGGMHGVGTAYDYAKVDADGYIRKAVRVFEQVDLGIFDYNYNSDAKTFTSVQVAPNIAPPSGGGTIANIVSQLYVANSFNNQYESSVDKMIAVGTNSIVAVKDSSYTDAAAFKAAMNGVPLIYELATPVEVELATPIYAKYLADKDGTEEITPANGQEPYTTPANLSILYAMDATGEIKNLPKNYLSKESAENMLNAMKSAGVISNYTMTYSNGKYVFTFTKPSA